MRTTRNICPRNCYDTCSMLSQVENGRLIKVAGDPNQTYTAATLCAKGYSYLEYVYHPYRILYPCRQHPRGSGNWKRISWEEALAHIASTILDSYRETGSFLSLGYMEGTGNQGYLAKSLSRMLSSLGRITQLASLGVGSALADAQLMDFGKPIYGDPEQMREADLILLWGTNPAATAIHQMRILQNVRKGGGEVILIDVYPSATSNKVDEFLLVNPGGDGALALALIRALLYSHAVDLRYLAEETEGWVDFRDWVLEADPVELAAASGVPMDRISWLAEKIAGSTKPALWIGKGLQKYSNSGQNIRAIHALAATAGLMSESGGGIYFSGGRGQVTIGDPGFWKSEEGENRRAHFLALPSKQAVLDPPISMLWINQSNPLVQGTGLRAFAEMRETLKMIVTMGHFLTKTAEQSDLFLPATTFFETEDLICGAWNQWIGLNEKTIEPLGEARTELEVAQDLTHCLNQLQAEICPFPASRRGEEWLQQAFDGRLGKLLGMSHYHDLRQGPKKIPQPISPSEDKKKFRFIVPEAMEQGVPEIPSLVNPSIAPAAYPYRLICVPKADRFQSQLGNLGWLTEGQEEDEILLGEALAKRKGIMSGHWITLYNADGEVTFPAGVVQGIPDKILICSARQDRYGKSVNRLVRPLGTDLGEMSAGISDLAYHETFVNIARLSP